jgi:hypothetical protein
VALSLAAKAAKAAKNRRRNSKLLAGYAANPASIPNPNRAVPVRPPSGTYDPGLDASRRASARGLGDLTMDLERDEERASSAFTLGGDRRSADFGTGMGRLDDDRAFESAGIARGFQRLGSAQSEQAAAMLGSSASAGGAMAESAAKRAANEGLQQGRLSSIFSRARADMSRDNDRAGEDAGTNFQYGHDDRIDVGARAGREDTLYGLDVADQRAFQAAQSGWRPRKPKKKGRR